MNSELENSEKIVVCVDKDGNEYEVLASQLRFRPAVYAVIIMDGKVLLSRQWDGYDFPGGGMKLGENFEEALAREVKEETGLEVKAGRIIECAGSFFKLPHVGDFVQSVLMYYACEIIGGEMSTEFFDKYEKEYAGMPEWVKLEEVGNIKFYNSADNLKIIQRARELLEQR